jgi:serine/threonine protein kinase
MGVVYLAEDTRLGRQVALKFLPATWLKDTKALDRFRVEARAASALSHPSICAIFDIGQDGDTPFIVMEALKGTTLRDRILKGSLKVTEVLEIGIQLADALEAAHTQGIVHRDIKPANIFLGDRNRVKVLDFGLAKLTGSPSTPSSETDTTSSGDGPKSNQMTMPGTTLGTVSYMSPEQARGELVDSRTDLFSLGAVLYEMVTGVQAFGGSTTALVFDAILNRAPRPISALNPLVPARLETVIATALEKDRDLRYQHASDLQAELKRIRRDLDAQSLAGSETVILPSRPSAPTAPVTATAPPPARANWPARIAILLAGLAIAAAAAILWSGFQPAGERAAAPASDAPTTSSAQPADTTVSSPPPAATTPAPVSERQTAPAPPTPTAVQPRPRATAPSETSPDSRASLPSPAVTPARPVQPGAVDAAPTTPPAATPSPTPPPPVAPAAPEEVKQQLPRTAAPAEQTVAPPNPAPAQQAPPPPRPAPPEPAPPAAAPVETDDAAIRRVIRVYEQAIETKDVALYRSVRTNLTREAETVLMNSFRQIDSQQIDIRIESLRIEGRTASARLVRQDTLVTRGRRDVRNSTQTMRFEKTNTGWLIAE